MNEIIDKAIVLRMGQFHEADLWLRLLCKENGLQTVFAFGGLKSLHRFCGCLDLFNTLECVIKVSRNGTYLNLEETTLLETPRTLRKNWQRMGLATNCMRFLETVAVTPEDADKAFSLLENLRWVLENFSFVPSFFPLYFRLASASITGFAPDFENCGICGKEITQDGYFYVEDGKIFCPECTLKAHANFLWLHLSANAVNVLKKVKFSLPVDWPTHELDLKDRSVCSALINSFIERHLGISFGEKGFQRINAAG